jgi:hypothetical protein
MHIENLKLMKTMLEEIQEGLSKGVTFDLNVFILANDVDLVVDWKNPSCGFSACALGFASADSRFRELGLRSWTSASEVCLLDADGEDIGLYGFDAAERLFEIDYHTCCYLFDPDEYYYYYTGDTCELDYTISCVGVDGDILPSHVIARIDYLLSKEEC